MTYSPESLIEPRYLRGADEGVVSPNERALLRLIWRNPGMSRSEITAHVDLTQQSVYRIIDQLEERCIVSLGAPKPGVGRGQPSPTLRLDGSHAYCCGISVNTDVIGLCVMDLSGRILGEASVPLQEVSMARALDLVAEALAGLQRSNGLSTDAFFGIGFAISGYHVGGTRYNAPLPLHEWSLIELGPMIASVFDRPVWVHNGANTATIAESMFGVGRYIKHFAYLSFNYGFGGGVIIDGELMLGGNGNAGEFSGVYDVEESKRRPALQYLIEKLNRNGVEVPSISYMRRYFDPAWPGVAEWVDEVTPAHNRMINAIRAVVDPQAIVFGGQVPSGLAQLLIDKTRLFDRPRYGVNRPGPKLIISEIATDASAMGAAVSPFRAAFY